MLPFILDSQLLLLLVVGRTSPDFISRHKRLSAFTASDFDLLLDLLDQTSAVVVLPNTLTETSNLLGQIGDPLKTHLFEVFAQLVGSFHENYVQSKGASARREFLRLGLADAAMLVLADESECVLLTADAGLYVAATNNGYRAVNFHHERQARGLI